MVAKPVISNAKYESTGETKTVFGITLHRIRAKAAIGNIAAGTLGGWIESEKNLAISGNAWVSDNAQVSGKARVFGNAQVYGNARVFENAQVSGNAWIYGNALVSGTAHVSGNAQVYSNAQVSGNANVYCDALVSGNALVYGNALVSGNAWVSGNAQVSGDAWISGNALVCNDAGHIIVGPVGPENGYLTAFVERDGTIRVTHEGFDGTIDEFAAAMDDAYGDEPHGVVYQLAIEMVRARFDATLAGSDDAMV